MKQLPAHFLFSIFFLELKEDAHAVVLQKK